jgi:hypothetical protein
MEVEQQQDPVQGSSSASGKENLQQQQEEWWRSDGSSEDGEESGDEEGPAKGPPDPLYDPEAGRDELHMMRRQGARPEVLSDWLSTLLHVADEADEKWMAQQREGRESDAILNWCVQFCSCYTSRRASTTRNSNGQASQLVNLPRCLVLLGGLH